MNILSFDIEEWYIEKAYNGGRKERYAQFDSILDHILELLNKNNITATFFCLGKIAEDFPYIIKKIASEGHEIGCHSYSHKWVNKMTIDEFRMDTHAAISALEDITGKKVVSFRAPAFSIGSDNKWAFDILVENGIQNDASVFPAIRDFGGFKDFPSNEPCLIKHNGFTINEFPIPIIHIPFLGKGMAYSGGGYFRLLPISFVEHQISKSKYTMCYFHIGDLLTETNKFMGKNEYEKYFKEAGTMKNRIVRYFKSNIGHNNALSKLDRLLSKNSYVSIKEYLQLYSLNKTINI